MVSFDGKHFEYMKSRWTEKNTYINFLSGSHLDINSCFVSFRSAYAPELYLHQCCMCYICDRCHSSVGLSLFSYLVLILC